MSFKYALKVAPEAGADRGQIAKAWNRQICVQWRKSAPPWKTGDNKRVRFRMNPLQGRARLLDVCRTSGCTRGKAEILFNIWSVRCRKEINSEIICWSSSAMHPNLSCAFFTERPEVKVKPIPPPPPKNEGDFSRMSLENVGGEAKNQVWASSSRSFLEAFNSSTSEPDTHGLLLCVGGKALWVCGQRNAAHISAIAAVEVMRSRVGACRASCTSLFCINKRMSYCCTNQAVFYWAGVCLRADRRSTPTPLPLIYTITSRDVCLAEAFPIPAWATPAHHRPGPSPQMFPMPTTGSRRQKRVRGIHLSVEDFIKITPALGLVVRHRRVHVKRRCAWKRFQKRITRDNWPPRTRNCS